MCKETYWITRDILIRAFGFIYLCVFVPLLFQYEPLLGEKGLLPVRVFMENLRLYYPDVLIGFYEHPTLFWFGSSDFFASFLIYLGVLLAILCCLGYGSFLIFFPLPSITTKGLGSFNASDRSLEKSSGTFFAQTKKHTFKPKSP